MALSFLCPNCSKELVLAYVRLGERFVCCHCDMADTVPEYAVETDASPTVVADIPTRSAPPLRETDFPSQANLSQPAGGFSGNRVFAIVASSTNALYILLSLIGLLVTPESRTPIGIFVILLYFSTAGLNIAVLSGYGVRWRGVLMAANIVLLVLFQLLVLVVNHSLAAKVGAVMIMFVGLLSYVALAVTTKESWLALRLERRRLEEKRRIAELKQQLATMSPTDEPTLPT